MEYSIDWGNEWLASLKWIAIASAVAFAGLLLVGFLLARYRIWGKQFWSVTGRFFTGRDTRVTVWLYIIVMVILAVFGVRMTVLFSYFGNDLYTSLQNVAGGLAAQGPQAQAAIEAGKTGFWHSVWVFVVIASVHVVRTLVEIYIASAFIIKWRYWLTTNAAADWMKGNAFYRNRFVNLGDRHADAGIQPGVDNPDQRIESDITNLASSSQSLIFGGNGSSTNGVIPALVSIVSFTQILWTLSGPMTVFGTEIPRLMVWLAFVYVLIATFIAFWIGRPLIRLNFWRERLTANFRYSLVRIRDGAENVALYRGADVEHRGLMQRFDAVVSNYWHIVYRSIAFTGWNFVVNQTSVIFPYLVQVPRFFSGQVTLGDLNQTVSAFSNVHDSLSFFRESYDSFADLRASIIRLDGLEDADRKSRELPEITTSDEDRAVRLSDVTISTPTGDQLITALNVSLVPGDALVVKGRSGSGKTTLLRGLAGLWPYATGEFARPSGDNTLFLSQVPYIPLGDLRTAVVYPATPDSVDDDAIRAALSAVFLPHLVDRLGEEDDWAKVLSPGEQQRIAFARILLNRPEVVFMDEATSAVDEGLEFALYQLIRSELPQLILVSVSHRSTTDQHHGSILEITGGGGWDVRPVPVPAGS